METPNCLRTFRYSEVISTAFSIAPTSSAHSAAVPCARPRVKIAIRCANQYGEDKLVGEAVVALA